MIYSVCNRGKNHIQKKQPRQDRYAVYQDDACIILVVADGHGGDSYVRSGFGARIACKATVDILRSSDSVKQYAELIKNKYDQLVKKHLVWKPLTALEKERLRGLPESYAYGTTLIGAKITSEEIVIFQVGDGNIHVVKQNGEKIPELPEDSMCIGQQTSSLVQEDALDRIRMAHYNNPVACVMLYTDGYEPRGGYPWEVMERIGPQYSLEEFKSDISKGDRYGDDQTALIFFDEDNFDQEQFREGIALGKKMDNKKRERKAIEDELAITESFLESAMKKYKKLPQKEQSMFVKRSIEPRYQKYLDLKSRLQSYK